MLSRKMIPTGNNISIVENLHFEGLVHLLIIIDIPKALITYKEYAIYIIYPGHGVPFHTSYHRRRMKNFNAQTLRGNNRNPALQLYTSVVRIRHHCLLVVRTQFPFCHSDSITLNKAQGPTFDKVGIYLV